MGVENPGHEPEMGTETEPNSFSPFRPGPGKPTLRRDYLFNQRDNLLSLIGPHWYEFEWKLRCARTPEQIHLALQIEAFKTNPGPLAALLRASSEAATRKDLELTRKRLGDAVQKMRSAFDRHQAQMRCYEDAQRVSFALSEDSERGIREELERRRRFIHKLNSWTVKVKLKIRELELEHKTRIAPTAARSAVLAALNKCMQRLQRDRAADERVCEDLEARLRSITPEARKFASDYLTRQKLILDSLEIACTDADKEQRALGTTFANQEAYVYRAEVLTFIQKREYALTPLRLSNAIAGLPYISARRSAQRCAHIKSKLTRSTTYELFELVTVVCRRYGSKPTNAFVDKFEKAIRDLPKFNIIEGHKRPNWFRDHLAENWYYLKRALQEPELAGLHPHAVPGAIVKDFLRKMRNPDSPITAMMAEAEKITD